MMIHYRVINLKNNEKVRISFLNLKHKTNEKQNLKLYQT